VPWYKVQAGGAHLDQKTFAVDHLANTPSHLRALAFQIRKGILAEKAVGDLILKNTASQTDVDRVRPIFNAEWKL